MIQEKKDVQWASMPDECGVGRPGKKATSRGRMTKVEATRLKASREEDGEQTNLESLQGEKGCGQIGNRHRREHDNTTSKR